MTNPIPTFSTPRFATYLTAADGDQTLALQLYHWNAEVGAAFHFEPGKSHCATPATTR